MSYPPEADMAPEEWMPPVKLDDVAAESLLQHLKEEEWNTSPNR